MLEHALGVLVFPEPHAFSVGAAALFHDRQDRAGSVFTDDRDVPVLASGLAREKLPLTLRGDPELVERGGVLLAENLHELSDLTLGGVGDGGGLGVGHGRQPDMTGYVTSNLDRGPRALISAYGRRKGKPWGHRTRVTIPLAENEIAYFASKAKSGPHKTMSEALCFAVRILIYRGDRQDGYDHGRKDGARIMRRSAPSEPGNSRSFGSPIN